MLHGDDDVTLPGAEKLGDQWLRGNQAVRLDAHVRTDTLDDGAELA